ncbi:MAG: 16S rRNA (cytidine(1402)-2'-O)-methyltransferase [Nitrospinaceae bacterium]|jgi:16S rRNA (cytidine1402-2'-O)-methyltransferase|nr:16S rRNA (cytidine(1402)-2'-O)-methyltransferase [Nitrospina sp.]MBT5375745.1 16S rRNA (cytidine(1402)-2'-O)-methyltransferase [Nitrospinaceae bacterium]MBT5867971.1 16S rRNA (cytidine(1402)-2'-O)-methyltransferase [Nitrospinaceae bacterium]MBT6345389.1 16S rRNA (cytidine(1402)-2'-O)-methyltransferase [Nitrospina sp.]
MAVAQSGSEETGNLFVVSTPIGNLGDVTHRSLEILTSVSLIAAEDTRRTRILLNRYEIKTPLSSYNSFNKIKKGRDFIERIKKGDDIALVSDAGTPGISDPHYHLVNGAIEEDISIFSIPGPSALLAALTVSGLPMDRFIFEGFLPRKKGRKTMLESLACEKRTVVIFESPNRIQKTLQDLYQYFGDRKIAIAREMTKLYEEIVRGNLKEISEQTRTWKGEITVVIAGNNEKKRKN